MDKGLEDIMNKAVYYNRHKQDIKELEAENKRLREVLEEIAVLDDDIDIIGDNICNSIARKALDYELLDVSGDKNNG